MKANASHIIEFFPRDRILQELVPHQFGKFAVLLHEFLITPFFYNLPVLKKYNPVAVLNRREAVCNHDTCAFKRRESLRNRLLRDIVKSAGRLIKDQQRWLLRNDAGDQEPLLLPARKRSRSVTYDRIHSKRHRTDIVGNPRHFRGSPCLLLRQSGT